MQKVCNALMLDLLGRLLAGGSDGCCYVLQPESLHQDDKIILHPSQTGKSFMHICFLSQLITSCMAFLPLCECDLSALHINITCIDDLHIPLSLHAFAASLAAPVPL